MLMFYRYVVSFKGSFNYQRKSFLNVILPLLPLLLFVNACGTTNTGGAIKIGPRIALNDQQILCPDRDKYPSNFLVLKNDRLSYDSGEVQQMKDYVQKNLGDASRVPATLAWLPVVDGKSSSCLLSTSLENTGDSPLQLNGVHVRAIHSAAPNTGTYRLIELCSLGAVNAEICQPQQCKQQCGGRGAGGEEFICTVNILLHHEDTLFTDSKSDCTNSIYFNPHDILKVQIYFNAQDNFTYNITPSFSIQTPKGPLDYTIQKSVAVSFAQADQFTCYRLQDQTFTPIPAKTEGTWCL